MGRAQGARPFLLPLHTCFTCASQAQPMGSRYQGHQELPGKGRDWPFKIPRMLRQRTLKSLTKAVGVGLHSGQRVELTLRPAQPDTGIVFRRVDLPIPVDIPISAQAVTDTRLASTISNGGMDDFEIPAFLRKQAD